MALGNPWGFANQWQPSGSYGGGARGGNSYLDILNSLFSNSQASAGLSLTDLYKQQVPVDTARSMYDIFLATNPKVGQQKPAPAAPAPTQAPAVPAGLGFAPGASNQQKRSQFASEGLYGNTGLYRTPEAQDYYRKIIRSLVGEGDKLLPVEKQFGQDVFGLNAQGLNMKSFLDALAPLPKPQKPKPQKQPFIPDFNTLFGLGNPMDQGDEGQ